MMAGVTVMGKLAEEKSGDATDEIIIIIKRAILAKSRSEWDKADKLCHMALETLSKLHSDGIFSNSQMTQAQTYIFDVMAGLALARGHLQHAETLYKQTLKGLLQQGMAKDDNAVVDISLKLAVIFATQQRYEEAEEGYQFCVETQRRKLSESEAGQLDENTKALLGQSLDAYGRFLLLQSQYSRAEQVLLDSISIAENVFGDDHIQVAALYSDLSNVQCMLNDSRQATVSIQKAIEIAEKTNADDLPVFYCNLGMIVLNKGHSDEALVSCRKALKLAKRLGHGDAEKQASECIKTAKERQ